MKTAYVVSGKLVNHKSIELRESLPLADGEIKLTVEKDGSHKKSRRELFGIWKGKIKMSL